MPWDETDATRHTKKANTSRKKEVWAQVSNEVLNRTGNEGRAVREANFVVRQIGHSKKKSKKRKRRPDPLLGEW